MSRARRGREESASSEDNTAAVVIEGIKFKRAEAAMPHGRKKGVCYITEDGTKLWNEESVAAYLRKSGMANTLPGSLNKFDFRSDLAQSTTTKEDASSQRQTPAKRGRDVAGIDAAGISAGFSQEDAEESDDFESPQPKRGKGKEPAEAIVGKKKAQEKCPHDRLEDRGGASRGGRAVGGKKAAEEGNVDEPEWKARNRALAQSRAAQFARGRGFVDDEDKVPAASQRKRSTNRGAGAGGAAAGGAAGGGTAGSSNAGADAGEESWPGPWSTASDVYSKREKLAEARKAAEGVRVVALKSSWVPRTRQDNSPRAVRARPIPNLQSMCVEMIAENIDACAEGLGAILPEMRARICAELARLRRLRADVLPLFTDGETSVLSLPDCSCIPMEHLQEAFERCQGPLLEALNLAFCGRAMSDRMLEAVCKASENLHTLQLGGCYLLTDRGIAAAVKALPRLRILELSSCTKLSENSLDSIVCVGDTLESLALRRCPQLKAEALARIGELRHLRRLSLEGSQGVTDDTVRRIVAGCGASLEELDLSHLPDSGFTAVPATCGVTDEALRVLAKGCSRLRRLSLRNVDTITDEGLTVLASGCRFLADIDLARCKAVSDDGVEALAAGCKGLERLSLNAAGRTDVDEETGAASHSITDRTLRALGGCPRLSRLDLSWCRGMSDEFLGELVDSADALDALVLRGCAQITDIFLEGHSNEKVEVTGIGLKQPSTLALHIRSWTMN